MADLQDDLQDLHTVLEMCGIEDPATRTLFLNLEGFNHLDDLGDLEDDSDVMATWQVECLVAPRPRGELYWGQKLLNIFRPLPGGFATKRNKISMSWLQTLMLTCARRNRRIETLQKRAGRQRATGYGSRKIPP
jgi:hypothetical protein